MSPKSQAFYVYKATSQRIKTETIQFPLFWQESRLTFPFLLVLAKKKREKRNFAAQLLMVSILFLLKMLKHGSFVKIILLLKGGWGE